MAHFTDSFGGYDDMHGQFPDEFIRWNGRSGPKFLLEGRISDWLQSTLHRKSSQRKATRQRWTGGRSVSLFMR